MSPTRRSSPSHSRTTPGSALPLTVLAGLICLAWLLRATLSRLADWVVDHVLQLDTDGRWADLEHPGSDDQWHDWNQATLTQLCLVTDG